MSTSTGGKIVEVGDFLEVRAQDLPWDVVKEAAAEIEQRHDIKRFFINGSPESKDSLSLLLNATQRNNLEILSFSRTVIDEPQARAIASALQQQPKLQRLHFDSVSIAPEAIGILASALHHHSSLENLVFEKCQLGDTGASALASALPTCASLKDVRLYDCEIGDEGAQALAKSIPQCPKLDAINLTNNHIGDKGLIAFANALEKNPPLSTLLLERNQFGSAGLRALAQSLQNNNSIHNLNVAFSNAKDLNLPDFLPLVELISLGNIATLNVSHQGLNNGHRQKIIETALKGGSKQLIGLSLDSISGEGFLSRLPQLFNYCNHNYKNACEAYNILENTNDSHDAAIGDLTRAAARLPAMKAIMRVHSQSGNAPIKPEILKAVEDAFSDLNPPHSLSDFITPNKQGITHLDSPDFWQEISHHWDEMEKQGTPMTLDFLMQPNRDGDPFLCSAVYSGKLKSTLAALDRHGEKLGEAELLENGQPAPLLQVIIDEGELPALFSRENWAGQSPQALRNVYRALPSGAQTQIGNYHALAAEVSRMAGQQGLQRD